MSAALDELRQRLEGRSAPTTSQSIETATSVAKDTQPPRIQLDLPSTPRRLFRFEPSTPLSLPAVPFGYREDTVTLSAGEYTESRKRGWFQIIPSELEAYLHHVWRWVRDRETEELKKQFFWLFISSGMEPVIGTELVMMVSRREDEETTAYPHDPIYLFHQLYNINAKLVAGTLIRLEQPVLRRADFRTLHVGMRNYELRNLKLIDIPSEGFGFTETELPKKTLHIVALTDTEAVISVQYGLNRVLAHLGLQTGQVPYPTYTDLGRESCLSLEQVKNSLPAAFTALERPLVETICSDSQITIFIPESEVEDFRNELLNKASQTFEPLVIYSGLHDDCNSIFVWRPDGQGVNIHNGETGDRISAASFIILFRGHEQDSIRQVSDGYIILLTSATWTRFMTAIQNRSSFQMSASNISDLTLHLSWPPHIPSLRTFVSDQATIVYGGLHRGKTLPRPTGGSGVASPATGRGPPLQTAPKATISPASTNVIVNHDPITSNANVNANANAIATTSPANLSNLRNVVTPPNPIIPSSSTSTSTLNKQTSRTKVPPQINLARLSFIHEPRPGDATPSLFAEYTRFLTSTISRIMPTERPQNLGPGGCLIVIQFCFPPPLASQASSPPAITGSLSSPFGFGKYSVKKTAITNMSDLPVGGEWKTIAILPPEAHGSVPLRTLHEQIKLDQTPKNMVLRGYMEVQLYYACYGYKLTDSTSLPSLRQPPPPPQMNQPPLAQRFA